MSKQLFDDVLELLLWEIRRSLNEHKQESSDAGEDFLTFKRPLEEEVFSIGLKSSWGEEDNQ